MTIDFNGRPMEISDELPLEDFIREHSNPGVPKLVRLNGVMVPRDAYGRTGLSPGDKLNIVLFMGGG